MATPSRSKQMKQMQKSAQRKRVRAQLRHESAQISHPSPKAVMRSAGGWKLYEVLLTENWQAPNELVQILVARRSPTGLIATGIFLVDLACLGVKSAAAGVFQSVPEYEERLRDGIMERQPMVPADINLVVKILREGVAYARSLGFEPDPDYRDAVLILGTADPTKSDVPVRLGGEDGKPCFIAGPYDDAKAIIAKLLSKCGPDGYHYVVPVNPAEFPGIEEAFGELGADGDDEEEAEVDEA